MRLFRIVKNPVLSKKAPEGVITLKDIPPAVEFHSDEVVSLTENDFIDTTDSLTIAKYKNNVELLLKKALQEGRIQDFRLVRDDDFFPYDWIWRASDGEVYGEYKKGDLTYQLRMMTAEDMVISKDNRLFPILTPQENEKIKAKAQELDPLYGRVFQPVEFRSTKHFTVNTPLGYTGEYNSGIEADRNYTIIDTMDAFLESGYGYSLHYLDSYLDVTHERLPISKDAIVLINQEKYENLIQDEKVKEQLKERKVILYKGEEAVAINMVLSQMGILPYRPGLHIEYPPEMRELFHQSIQSLCDEYNLEFAHNHGNINGKGGHFTDLLDQNRLEFVAYEGELIAFLKKHFPGELDDIDRRSLRDSRSMIEKVGYQRMRDAILLYNEETKQKIERSRVAYDFDRDSITPDIHELFVSTVQLVRKMFQENFFSTLDTMEANQLKEDIIRFYQEKRVEDQVRFAQKVQEAYQKHHSVSK